MPDSDSLFPVPCHPDLAICKGKPLLLLVKNSIMCMATACTIIRYLLLYMTTIHCWHCIKASPILAADIGDLLYIMSPKVAMTGQDLRQIHADC